MKYKIEPWKHQANVIDKVILEKLNFYALFHDMGAGKTKTTTEILRFKCAEHDRVLRTLIICPIAVLENWKREIVSHSYIEENQIQIIDGMSPVNHGEKTLKSVSKKRLNAQLNSGKPILIINTEKVGLASIWPDIEAFKPEFLIVDEVHKFKDPLAKRVKKLHKFTNTIKPLYRFILTGSPILNSPMDIWAQFFILDPEILGRNFYSFRSEYFYDANAGMPSNVHFPNWKVKDAKYYKSIGHPELKEKDTLNKLNKIIYAHADRVMKSEVMDLPPITYQSLSVPLTKEQLKIYNDMHDEALAFLDENKVNLSDMAKMLQNDFEELDNAMSADLAIVKILRLQQIIAGVFKRDTGEIVHIKNNRYKILGETLEEILSNKENKVIIWSVFKDTYELIAEKIPKGVDYTFLTGLQSSTEKQDNIDKFNNDKNCRVIIANQGAGGTGVNLTAANYSLYFTRSFKLEHDLQSEARNHRGGQEKNVTRIDLVTPNTIDTDILLALEGKKNMSEDILKVKKDFTPKEILALIKAR